MLMLIEFLNLGYGYFLERGALFEISSNIIHFCNIILFLHHISVQHLCRLQAHHGNSSLQHQQFWAVTKLEKSLVNNQDTVFKVLIGSALNFEVKTWSPQEACAELDGCIADQLLLAHVYVHTGVSAACCNNQPSIFLHGVCL